MNFESISRRSFLKKTTVLAIGVSSLTLYSGLVNAGEPYACYPGPGMDITKTDTGIGHEFPDGSIHWVLECTLTGKPGCCNPGTLNCGQFSKDGKIGTLENVKLTYLTASTGKCYA